MPNDIMQWFATLGVGGILAGGMFLVYRKDMKQNYSSLKEQLAREEKRSEALIEVLKENTEAITLQSGLIDAWHRRLDRVLPEIRGHEHGSNDAGRLRR